jgi:hypothetical protein
MTLACVSGESTAKLQKYTCRIENNCRRSDLPFHIISRNNFNKAYNHTPSSSCVTEAVWRNRRNGSGVAPPVTGPRS